MHPTIRRLALAVLLAVPIVSCGTPPAEPPEPAPIPVRAEVAEATSFRPSIRTWGRVTGAGRLELRTPRSGTLELAPRWSGVLPDGEAVEAGETIFRVRNREAEHRLRRARLDLERAEAEVDWARRGVEARVKAEADLERARIEARLAAAAVDEAETELERLEVRAPEAGTLLAEGSPTDGAEVAAGETVVGLGIGGGTRVELWIAPERRDDVRPGSEVVLRAPGETRVLGRGRVREIASVVGEGGALRVLAEIEEDLGLPPPGDGVDVLLLLPPVETITLPERALEIEAGAPVAYVLEPRGDRFEARRTSVRLGLRGEGRVAVLGGLGEGDRVAVDGVELLSDGVVVVEVEAEDGEDG